MDLWTRYVAEDISVACHFHIIYYIASWLLCLSAGMGWRCVRVCVRVRAPTPCKPVKWNRTKCCMSADAFVCARRWVCVSLRWVIALQLRTSTLRFRLFSFIALSAVSLSLSLPHSPGLPFATFSIAFRFGFVSFSASHAGWRSCIGRLTSCYTVALLHHAKCMAHALWD